MNPDPISPNLRAPSVESEATLSSATAGPGRVIRQARERARVSLEELAAQTRLAKTTLEALERDDFTQLNEAVYVRGYYRKCAKVLSLPEAELIAAYDKLYAPKTAPMPTKMLVGHSGSTMGPSADGGSAASWSIIVIIAALLGAGAWLLTQGDGVPTAAVAVDAAVTPPSLPAAAVMPASDAPRASSPEAAMTAPTGPTLAVAGSLSDPAASGGTSALPPAPTPGVALAPATTLANANPEPSVPAAEPTTAVAAAPVAAPAVIGPGSLVLNFKSASWVRIEDADGRLLLSGTVQAGDRQVLNGRTPYALFIGYAPGVTVEFGGKAFDLTPHIRQNSTARLNLPYVAGPAP